MKNSDKLNGYWEEGYHYFLEFRDDRLTVRNYMRKVALETKVKYDAASIEEGRRTVILLKDNVLSRDYEGNMMTEIKELAWEDGKLQMLYNYTIMGETLYTLEKKENGPFAHIIIRDEEFVPKLQGVWKEWSPSGVSHSELVITGRRLKWLGVDWQPFHAVTYTYDKDEVFLVPEDLTEDNFRGFLKITVKPDMLLSRMMVFDASVPESVFARPGMLDKIEVPASAKAPIVSTMTYQPMGGPSPMMGFTGMTMGSMSGPAPEPAPAPETNDDADAADDADKCPCCGYVFQGTKSRFCPECGSALK